MRALLVLVLVVVLTAVIWTLVRNWLAQRRDRRPQRWSLEERSDGELVTLRAMRRGDEPLLLGSVPIAAADFDTRLYELRVEAETKVAALNDRPELTRPG